MPFSKDNPEAAAAACKKGQETKAKGGRIKSVNRSVDETINASCLAIQGLLSNPDNLKDPEVIKAITPLLKTLLEFRNYNDQLKLRTIDDDE